MPANVFVGRWLDRDPSETPWAMSVEGASVMHVATVTRDGVVGVLLLVGTTYVIGARTWTGRLYSRELAVSEGALEFQLAKLTQLMEEITDGWEV